MIRFVIVHDTSSYLSTSFDIDISKLLWKTVKRVFLALTIWSNKSKLWQFWRMEGSWWQKDACRNLQLFQSYTLYPVATYSLENLWLRTGRLLRKRNTGQFPPFLPAWNNFLLSPSQLHEVWFLQEGSLRSTPRKSFFSFLAFFNIGSKFDLNAFKVSVYSIQSRYSWQQEIFLFF